LAPAWPNKPKLLDAILMPTAMVAKKNAAKTIQSACTVSPSNKNGL
jgi:hypothetical protein